MINSIKLDGVLRERKSKSLFTDSYSEIEIQCYECGKWVKIKKIENDHIVKKFNCGSCKRKIKPPVKRSKNSKAIKKAVKKVAKKRIQFPEDCPHKPFFKCTVASQCQGCYYNPDKAIALMPKKGQEFEKGEKKNTKDHWFYGDKSHVKKALGLLEDIKTGKGLHKGGARCHFKYARKNNEEDE